LAGGGAVASAHELIGIGGGNGGSVFRLRCERKGEEEGTNGEAAAAYFTSS
jgi:hypothetical protein